MELNKVVHCPRYCSVYNIDNLLVSLKNNDIGCHVGSHFLWDIWVRGRHHAFKSKCKRPTKYVRLL